MAVPQPRRNPVVTITAEAVSGYRIEITNGRHQWLADEPVELGGDDSAPSPYELLLGSLAACTCITVTMYAQRKGISLTSVSASYTYDRIHADDCEFCEEDASGFIDTVRSQVFLEGDFDDAQRERLAEVARRCPVHKTLERGITFTEEVFVG
jgi:putative redox protein